MENEINNINEEDWEKICTRCGQCCHVKLRLKHLFIVDPGKACEHLGKNGCNIYADRLHEKNCIHIKEALNQDLMLPASCPYTKLKPGYHGFVMPDQESFDTTILLCMLIENEEKRLGRDMTDEEIMKFEVTQEKIDEVYGNNKGGYSALFLFVLFCPPL